MKVLFFFYLPSGGMNTLNRLRARALRTAGIESHLLFLQHGSGAADLEPDIPVFYTADPAQIGQLLQIHNYDAIVTTSLYLQLQLLRNVGYRGPIIFENQGFGPLQTAKQAMRTARPYIDGYVDALLYPATPHIGEVFREVYPHLPQFAFPNLFDPDSFGYVPSSRNPDRPVLAWIGRLDRNKNWRDFLRVGAETAKRVRNLHLWMFTDPAIASPGERERLRYYVQRLKLRKRLTHYRNIPHRRMPDFLSRVGDSGGVLLITSKGESGSYAAAEALSCRCPVVTTDSEGVRSAIVDGVTGLYFPHGDIAAGAYQVRRLIKRRTLRQQLLVQGIHRLRTELSPDRYVQNFVSMLGSLGVGARA